MQTASIQITAIGAFAAEVADQLRSRHNGVSILTLDDTTPPPADSLTPAGVHIAIAPRCAPDLCEALQTMALDRGSAFLPVSLDRSMLYVGPFVAAGVHGCWSCWRKRYAQHSRWYREEQLLEGFYRDHPASYPHGYAHSVAAVAAARIDAVLEGSKYRSSPDGEVWSLDLDTRQMQTFKVIGVHGCKACGSGTDEATRSVAAMRSALQALWQTAAQ